MRIWAVGIFLGTEGVYTHIAEILDFMDGPDIQDILRKVNQDAGSEGSLVRVVMAQQYTPPLEWDVKHPALICNAGGNDLMLANSQGNGLSELAWEKKKLVETEPCQFCNEDGCDPCGAVIPEDCIC